ncbi:hypothetical protein PCANC_19765 [Puccinia coronata f. sp. avenae]|uniref:Uncharacterized protein n=1 Tax=Puccinia coronata f. sp. avenae TaxID=200324 RepID=A0A2N5UB53_9BASI|nr:hypothetical protein PCANC_19765 [Puccinia coronata f. sp. avenae]
MRLLTPHFKNFKTCALQPFHHQARGAVEFSVERINSAKCAPNALCQIQTHAHDMLRSDETVLQNFSRLGLSSLGLIPSPHSSVPTLWNLSTCKVFPLTVNFDNDDAHPSLTNCCPQG